MFSNNLILNRQDRIINTLKFLAIELKIKVGQKLVKIFKLLIQPCVVLPMNIFVLALALKQ